MTKLSDTQLIVLSSAAKHDEGLARRPANLNAAAAMKVASSLSDKGLVREIRAKADAPVWHEMTTAGSRFKITRAGRDAIGVEDDEAQDGAPASPGPSPAKSKKSGAKPAAKKDAEKGSSARAKGAHGKPADIGKSSGQFRAGSKQAKIVDLMKRAKGATLDEMVDATDWLPAQTRAYRRAGDGRGQRLRLTHQV